MTVKTDHIRLKFIPSWSIWYQNLYILYQGIKFYKHFWISQLTHLPPPNSSCLAIHVLAERTCSPTQPRHQLGNTCNICRIRVQKYRANDENSILKTHLPHPWYNICKFWYQIYQIGTNYTLIWSVFTVTFPTVRNLLWAVSAKLVGKFIYTLRSIPS